MATERISASPSIRIPGGMENSPPSWKWVGLDSICIGIYDCPHSTPKLTLEGPYVARTQDVITGLFRADGAAHVSQETYKDRIKRAEPSYGDLLYSREGTYFGIAAEVPSGVQVCLGQRMVLIRPDAAHVDHRFLRYWLNSPVMSTHVHGQRDGSVAERLNLPTIRALPIPLPDAREQQQIATVLGALDDKIAVNERIATTTDKLASASFSALMASCLAPEEVVLGEVAEVNSRSVKPDDEGNLRYIDISSVGVGLYGWPDRIAWGDAPGRARRKADPGSTVWSTVRPNRRSHALVLDEDPDLVFSTGLAVLTPSSVGPAFLYEATRTPEFQNYLESVAEGSAYPAVRAEKFKEAPIFLPQLVEREKFEAAVMAVRRRAHQATLESRTLAVLRDTLLPQLISGRLRVKDAEKIVEDHT